MCGIFGFFDREISTPPDKAKLRETGALLSHRGPDHEGVFSEPSIGLVHTRLSLVDLDPRSNQPFWDKTGRYALVFNGEIYNYKSLRDRLEKKGISFRTSGDTEVLLESVLSEGFYETLPKLEGMFAFALYDRNTRSLLLARDRIGMKPLYVHDDGRRFVFSSEVQAMRPWIPWEANKMMIAPLLSGLFWTTEGHTLFEGVRSVAPGTAVEIRPDAPAVHRRFFALSDFLDEGEGERLNKLSPVQAVDFVEEKLLASVRMQMQADAPLGVFCSGGVDSSLIAAMTARLHNNLTIFHSNIVGKESECGAAKALADHLKLEFVTSEVRDADYLDRIPDAMRFAEYPYRHLPTSPPFLMLSETARARGVKGLLTGEAADECFLGYSQYAPDLLKGISQLPRGVLRFMKKALKGFPGESAKAPEDFVSRFQQHFRLDLEREEIRRALHEKTNGKVRRSQLLSLHDFIDNIRALNHRNDSMGMGAGVECRFPFLDSDVVRAGINLPDRYKLRLSATALDRSHVFIRDKWVIRQIADRYLPRKLSRRTKIGWPTSFLERMEISPGFFKESCVRDWMELSEDEIRHSLENGPQGFKTALLYLEVWAHVCFYRKPKEAVSQRLKEHVRIRPQG
jgi:asparagine synthase (glutamine-hydrolysing)